MITYEKLDVELQVVVPVVNFSSTDILHRTYELDFSGDARYAVLALRSTFVETLVKLPSKFGSERMSRLLQAVNAEKIAKNVYSIDNTKLSVYAMIEVLSSTSVRVSAKTASHLKLILCTLEYEVSIPVTSAEEESCIEAAKALIEELETYLGDPDLARMQRARIKSDLLIP
ncbi:hypothetical protein KPH14_011523 [Odynerus spinipes]|uniref:Uncharacterized protein n=1 Tax=Odynerus spinipes TaxID=1348599 RepID=A0AAD9VN60_9HYME|nr:hypothetical protein KPH14_011523 [Odynerus spinipes]